MKTPFAIVALATTLTIALPRVCSASEGALVFYLDKNYRAITKFDRLTPISPAVTGVLAMYALQNGAGCGGRSDAGLQCKLTHDLGFSAQCSPEHIALVRRTFRSPLPPMSGYAERLYAEPQTPNALESICSLQPDTASWQRVWTAIRIQQSEGSVVVNARGSWRTPEANGGFAYRTKYRLKGEVATVVWYITVPSPGPRE